MARAAQRPGPRPRPGRASNLSPGPEPELSPGAATCGPVAPARLHRSRRYLRPEPPARPRSPTPWAGRCRTLPRRRCQRSRAAQAAKRPGAIAPGNRGTPGSAAGGGCAERASGQAAGAGGRPGEPLDAGMEPGEKRPSSTTSDGDRREEHTLKQGIAQDPASSPRLDKFKIARQLTDRAIKEKKIFSIYGHFPVVRAALRRKGWVEKFPVLPKGPLGAEDSGEGVPDHKCTEVKESQQVALEKAETIHDMMAGEERDAAPALDHQEGRRGLPQPGRGPDAEPLREDGLLHHQDPELRGLSGQLVDAACRVCQAYLGQLEHEDIDVLDAAEELTEAEWQDLTQQYYSLVHDGAFICNSRNYLSQCQTLLRRIMSVSPQTEIDGLQNIWILKPAAKSRGRGITCMDRVEEILELVAAEQPPTKDSRWVIQKYIETPMLIHDTKFDIRQWFLVTDWNPLTVWFYKESYLRFCTQRFSLHNLDSAAHLCNNSIQRNLQNDSGRSPLLPGHNTWTSSRFQEYLQRKGRGAVWGSVIYPSMKRAISHAVRLAQDRVEARKNSFELYGADFILGSDFKPWLIEINSSPSMHPSTPVTAQLCAQVQEDTIKVVVDRKLDRNCDTGNFELLWKQPAVELPPFGGSDLCVQGVSVRKPRKQTLPIASFNFSAPLSHPRSSSALPGPARGPPRLAVQRGPRLKEEKVLSRLAQPGPLKRGCRKAGSTKAPAETELPACRCRPEDSKAPRSTLTEAPPTSHEDPNLCDRQPLAPALQSGDSTEGALCPSPRVTGPPSDLRAPCLVCQGPLPPARPCKRCRSFCASVLQGATFVPLGGGRDGPWTL
ncbi:protein monoglycylase TTLL8 isoform X4 [Oryctolagus cuniculus]|uniref:protein monoglycylase TTLL8 isoform X4 n=1 Tax=Oryctolagus cuniculus TaxID=9986 RepID=UPI00387A4EA7